MVLSRQAVAGLMLHYSFDDPSNLGADNSGHGHNAVNSGATFFASGNRGGAASFNGASSFLTAPLDVGITAMPKMTWGAWLKPTSVTTVRYPFLSNDDGGFDRQLTIAQRNGTEPFWAAHVGTGIYISTAAPSLSDWTFVAAVYDNSVNSMNLYVNESQYAVTTGFQSPSQSDFNIGTNTDFNRFFAGYLDDVFVFDTVLTSNEIASIRLNGITTIPEPSSATSCVVGVCCIAILRRKRKIARRTSDP
jgi:uncharacterized membrane protein